MGEKNEKKRRTFLEILFSPDDESYMCDWLEPSFVFHISERKYLLNNSRVPSIMLCTLTF